MWVFRKLQDAVKVLEKFKCKDLSAFFILTVSKIFLDKQDFV